MKEFVLKRPTSNAVPVFSVRKCSNPTAERDTFLTFSSLDFETDSKYGVFDLATGLFTVKTAGTYMFKFIGYVSKGPNKFSHRVAVKGVDGDVKAAVSYTATSSKDREYLAVPLSANTAMKIGEKIGIFWAYGDLYDAGHVHVTRFSCFFLPAEEKECQYDW